MKTNMPRFRSQDNDLTTDLKHVSLCYHGNFKYGF